MSEFMHSFVVRWLGPVAFSCLLLMVALTVAAIATCQIGLMIPAMILGVISMFTLRGEV